MAKKAQDTAESGEMVWVWLTDRQGFRRSKTDPVTWYGPGEVEVPYDFAVTLNQSPANRISNDNLMALMLLSAGYDTVDKIGAATDKELMQVEGVGPQTVKAIREKYGNTKAAQEVSNG